MFLKKKRLVYTLFCVLCFAIPSTEASYFTKVSTDGFGNVHTTGGLDTQTMTVFQGRLCVGVSNQVDGAKVMAFDGTAWIQVNESGFGTSDNTAISSMTASSQHLYVGTTNRNGGQVWAWDGNIWQCLHTGRFGTMLSNSIKSMALYKNRLIVGLWDQISSKPAEIWSFDGQASWERINEPGFGSVHNLCAMALYVSDVDGSEKLYALVWKSTQYTGKDAGCEIWAYDNQTWHKKNSGREGFGEKGRGRAGMEPFSVVQYKGKLYVGLWGFGAGFAWEVWSYDGTQWQWANKAIAKQCKFLRLCFAMTVYNDELYVAATDGFTEFELWSYDEKNWKKIISEGCATPAQLGDPGNKLINAMTVYKDKLYLGVVNERAGYRVWQSNFPRIDPEKKIMSSGETQLFKLLNGAQPVRWSSSDSRVVAIDDHTGFGTARSPGTCSITATDAFDLVSPALDIVVRPEAIGTTKNIFIFSEAVPRVITNDISHYVQLLAQVYVPPDTSERIDAVHAELSSIGLGAHDLLRTEALKSRQNGAECYMNKIVIPQGTAAGSYEFTISAQTNSGNQYSSIVTLTVQQGYTVPEIIALETKGTSYHIPILFDVKNLDRDLCTVSVEYQAEGGNWLPATIESASGWIKKYSKQKRISNKLTKLETTLAINRFICVWKSEEDIGRVSGTYFVRLTPEDKNSQGMPVISHPISINNEADPVDEMVYVPAGDFFIDKYEYPNHYGFYPKVYLTLKEARQECLDRGKELCSAEQWQMAYYGNSNKKYPYGDEYSYEGRYGCNTPGSDDNTAVPAGIYENCINDLGIYDLGGNVYEWVICNDNEACMADRSYLVNPMDSSLINMEDPDHKHKYLGHRCCSSAVAGP